MYSSPPPRAVRPLAWLPNREGFAFLAQFKDGTQCRCVVERRADGTHFIGDADIEDMTGWLPMPMGAGR